MKGMKDLMKGREGGKGNGKAGLPRYCSALRRRAWPL